MGAVSLLKAASAGKTPGPPPGPRGPCDELTQHLTEKTGSWVAGRKPPWAPQKATCWGAARAFRPTRARLRGRPLPVVGSASAASLPSPACGLPRGGPGWESELHPDGGQQAHQPRGAGVGVHPAKADGTWWSVLTAGRGGEPPGARPAPAQARGAGRCGGGRWEPSGPLSGRGSQGPGSLRGHSRPAASSWAPPQGKEGGCAQSRALPGGPMACAQGPQMAGVPGPGGQRRGTLRS